MSSSPIDVWEHEMRVRKPLSSSGRHSLPNTSNDESRRRRLQHLLDNPMMQDDGLGWTRHRQRQFIQSRIVAYGGTP